MLTETLEKHIGGYFNGGAELTKHELVTLIKKDFPSWSDNTINIYISRLKKAGRINALSRGLYGITERVHFHPDISAEMKRIYNAVHRQLPYVTLCIWDTNWLNAFMLHQPFKHYIVLEVEKDAENAAYNILAGRYKNVFVNPDQEVYERYISKQTDAIIVKALVSESPVTTVENTNVPALEKLLVDMLSDTTLFAAQQNEKEDIMRNAVRTYTLNYLKMRRYALRRNREQELDKLWNINLAERV